MPRCKESRHYLRSPSQSISCKVNRIHLQLSHAAEGHPSPAIATRRVGRYGGTGALARASDAEGDARTYINGAPVNASLAPLEVCIALCQKTSHQKVAEVQKTGGSWG